MFDQTTVFFVFVCGFGLGVLSCYFVQAYAAERARYRKMMEKFCQDLDRMDTELKTMMEEKNNET